MKVMQGKRVAVVSFLILLGTTGLALSVCVEGELRDIGTQKGYQVRPHNGVPTIFHHGNPLYANLYANLNWTRSESVAEHAQRMAGAGVHIHQLEVNQRWDPSEKDVPFLNLDARIRGILEMDPDARFFLRVQANTPGSWYEEYPEELMATESGEVYQLPVHARSPHSFASMRWREGVGEQLRVLIEDLKKTDYYDRIVCFMHTCGIEGQWTWWGLRHAAHAIDAADNLVTVDYSPAMLNYFRGWLQREYNHDVAALRESWGEPDVTFETAALPSEALIDTTHTDGFRDPGEAETRKVLDYFRAYADSRTDTLEYWGKIVKEHTSESPKLYGGFVGSVFNMMVGGARNAVRHADSYTRMMQSPYIDFFAAPPFTRTREQGKIVLSPMLIHSMLLHNKFFFWEFDQPTHLNEWDSPADIGETTGLSQKPEDLDGSLAMLKKHMGSILCTGRLGVWWWDQGLHPYARKHEGPQGEPNWFNDPAITDLFGQFSEISRDSLTRDCASVSEIAVYFSEETPNYMCPRTGRNEIMQQIRHFGKIGAPFDVFEINDFAASGEYKLYIFWNAYYVSDDLRSAIDQKLAGSGSTVLWIHKPGIVRPDGISAGNISELTGFDVGVIHAGVQMKQAVPEGATHPLADSLHGQELGIMNRPREFERMVDIADPFFFIRDGEAVAVNTVNGETVLAIKTHDGFNSVYSTFYPLDASLLRNVARFAGVHLYSSHTNDVIYANRSYLAVHTVDSGERTIYLPGPAEVIDVFSGATVSSGSDPFRLEMGSPDTRLLRLDAMEEAGPR